MPPVRPLARPLRVVLCAACLICLGPAGCAGRPTVLTPAVQNSFGARTFAAPFAATFAAARDALPALGYTLAVVDAQQGRITTERRQAGARFSIGLFGTEAAPLFRQYDLRIQPVDGGHTRVLAIPRRYAGERDVSHERVWDLDGDQGEQALWRQLFEQIAAKL